jgi:hypothetical protein
VSFDVLGGGQGQSDIYSKEKLLMDRESGDLNSRETKVDSVHGH